MLTMAISPEGDFQRSSNKAEPSITNIITAKSPAETRIKDLKKDFCGLSWIVGSIYKIPDVCKILDPLGSRNSQVLLFFFKDFQVHLFFFDLRNVEVFQKGFNA